jgi:hypothetical protein
LIRTVFLAGSEFISTIKTGIHFASKGCSPRDWRFCVLGKTNLACWGAR